MFDKAVICPYCHTPTKNMTPELTAKLNERGFGVSSEIVAVITAAIMAYEGENFTIKSISKQEVSTQRIAQRSINFVNVDSRNPYSKGDNSLDIIL